MEVKACPFCGNPPEIRWAKYSKKHMVKCCEIVVELKTWNTRDDAENKRLWEACQEVVKWSEIPAFSGNDTAQRILKLCREALSPMKEKG